jgi:hypothetical protein
VVVVSVLQGSSRQHDGGNIRTRDYKVSNYKTDDKAELMEKNFGNEGEDDDTFRGQLA